MEKENITLDPRSSFTPSSSADIPVPPDGLVQRSTRIKRIQATAMLLLFFAAVINYLDRSSLSVANLTIREELGLSATEIGALLSVFSLAYGIAQLPCGPLLDRKGPRLMLGLGMFSGHCSRQCLAWCTALRSSCWCVSVWELVKRR